MKRRVDVKETVIAVGAIVRLKKATRPSERMARWVVIEMRDLDAEEVLVRDVDDPSDERTFQVEDLDRVSGGVEIVTGHEYVWEDDIVNVTGGTSFIAEGEEDDFFDDGENNEETSLFDDPIALQMAEDLDDPDHEQHEDAE
jgi:hypothetical protein